MVLSIKSMTLVAVILFIGSVATVNLDVLVLMVGITAEAAAEISISYEDIEDELTVTEARAVLMVDDVAGIGHWYGTDDVFDKLAVSVAVVANEVATNEAIVVAIIDVGVAAASVANDSTAMDSYNEGELVASVEL